MQAFSLLIYIIFVILIPHLVLNSTKVNLNSWYQYVPHYKINHIILKFVILIIFNFNSMTKIGFNWIVRKSTDPIKFIVQEKQLKKPILQTTKDKILHLQMSFVNGQKL